MPSLKKIASVSRECVACGCCVKECPKNAISVHKGLMAVVDRSECVGCGKCVRSCPADVIRLEEVHRIEQTVV